MNKSKTFNLVDFAYISWLREHLCTLIQSGVCRKITVVVFLCIHFSYCIADDSVKIILFLSGSTQAYQTVANDTIINIKKKCLINLPACPDIIFKSVALDQEPNPSFNDANMMIVFGTKAASASATANFERQTIISMIPKQSNIDQINHLHPDRVTKIFIDQPFERYLDLIKTVVPRASRIGLLLHLSDKEQSHVLERSAISAGFELMVGLVDSNDDIGEALSQLLGNIDVLLALPDSRIHNSNTISNILTTSYRNHIPVIGFSSAYVKAGAIAAVYTSLNDISHQASEVAIRFLANGEPIEQNLTAKYFSISFNVEVARSLEISIRSPSEIKETILNRDSAADSRLEGISK